METNTITPNTAKNPFETFEIQHQRYLNPALNYKNEYDELLIYYKDWKNKQGFVGKIWDKIKNLANINSSSQNVEKALENYKNSNNENSKNEAVQKVNNYAKSQNSALIFTRNCASSMLAAGCVFLLKKSKAFSKISPDTMFQLKITIGTIMGAIGAIALKKVDAMSANREYSKNELRNDAAKGAAQGLITTLSEFFVDLAKISNKFLRYGAKKISKFAILGLNTFAENHLQLKKSKLFTISTNFIRITDHDKYEELNNEINEKIKEQETENTDKINFYGE